MLIPGNVRREFEAPIAAESLRKFLTLVFSKLNKSRGLHHLAMTAKEQLIECTRAKKAKGIN